VNRTSDGFVERIDKILHPLYKRLHGELDTEDFVFCYTIYVYWHKTPIRRLWVLDVPYTAVIRYTDSDSWDRLYDLSDKSPALLAGSSDWNTLFLDDTEARNRIETGGPLVIPLIQVPISPDWVACKARFSKGPNPDDKTYGRTSNIFRRG
jgi:hypothetical protein